jgi:dUTP pyrophosphatase
MTDYQKQIVLNIWIDSENEEWKLKYQEHVNKHNVMVKTDNFPNSGFDLFVPTNNIVIGNTIKSTLLDLKIRTEMVEYNNGIPRTIAYYMYPRSSFSKTPLLLANHTGIIDAGYRGNLKAALRNLGDEDYLIEKNTSIVQICHPQLLPFKVEIVSSVSELSTSSRGDGGFGSTGR